MWSIRRCTAEDREQMVAVINDGSRAYRGVIPADRLKAPYFSPEELQHEIEEGVAFWGYDENGLLAGVMGLQRVEDVTLIRHAYVRSASQGRGIGGKLLASLQGMAEGRILVGTWADAVWAIRFYQRHGFQVVTGVEKDRLLRRYWKVPERQIETSVVLAGGGREENPVTSVGE